jgi:hypothetical protein
MKAIIANYVRLGDLADFRIGPPFRERIIHEPGGMYGIVQGKDVGEDGKIHVDEMARLTRVPGKGNPEVLRAGEIVLQTRGRSYRAALVQPTEIPLVAAGSLCILTPRASRIDPEYLVLLLNLPTMQASLRQLATGSYILNLRRSAVEEVEVPLPSLANQRRLIELGRLVRKQAEVTQRVNQLWLQELHALALKCAKQQQKVPLKSERQRGSET